MEGNLTLGIARPIEDRALVGDEVNEFKRANEVLMHLISQIELLDGLFKDISKLKIDEIRKRLSGLLSIGDMQEEFYKTALIQANIISKNNFYKLIIKERGHLTNKIIGFGGISLLISFFIEHPYSLLLIGTGLLAVLISLPSTYSDKVFSTAKIFNKYSKSKKYGGLKDTKGAVLIALTG